MATEIEAGPLVELRRLSAAAGLSLTSATAYSYLGIPKNTSKLFIITHDYVGANVVELGLSPFLCVLRVTDNLASEPKDYSDEAQDNDGATHVPMSSFNTLANGAFLLVGSHVPFAGVYVDMDTTVNSTASVLTVHYRDKDNQWTSISATDGTASGGASLAQDGAVSWTIPSAWKAAALADIFTPTRLQFTVMGVALRDIPMYWTRWSWSAQLDSSVNIDAMYAVNRATDLSAWRSGQTLEFKVHRGPGANGLGALQFKIDAGTSAKVTVNRGNSTGRM